MAVTTNFSFTLTDFDKIPWHTEEHNNWHEVDALLARYLAVSNVKGVWQNALTVAVGERYIDSSDDTIWEVLVAHTTSSTLTFAANRTAQSTYWQSISVDASYAGDWAAGESYTVNQFVSDSKRYGVVTVAHTSVTSYNQGVSDGNITTLIDASDLISTSPVATTLSAGSSATVTYNTSTGVFTFGLPTGATGDTGATGSVEGTLSTRGDILVRNASNVTARLAVGAANTVLKSDGSDVAYSTIATANIANDAVTSAKIAAEQIDSDHYIDGSIDTAHIGNTQVTTGKIATNAIDGTLTKDALIADYSDVTITAADLIMYGDATDSNNTKRDTVQGVLDLVGGGVWNIIGTDEAGGGSGQASLDVTGLDSTYDQYAIGLSNVLPITDQVGAYFRFGDSSGVDSGSSDYSVAMEEMSANDDSGAQGYGSDTEAAQMHVNLVQSGGSGIGNASTEGFGGMFFLHRPGDAQILPMMSGFFAFVDNYDVEMQCGNFFGSRKAAIVLDRIQFLFSSGNVEVGRMTVWGIAHA